MLTLRKVLYMGLERIESRYTHQLEDWNRPFFEARGIPFVPVYGTMPGEDVAGKIITGSVLDAHGRTHYSLTQNAELIKMLRSGLVTSDDVIFYEDMFTPGIESLPYIFAQTPAEFRPRVYVRCLAQTIDPDDFVNRTGMFDFMRPFEQLVDSFVDGILVASDEMVAHLTIAGFKAPIFVTGLPYGKAEVASRVPSLSPWATRPKRVSFAARWDEEKQPHFFMDVIEKVWETDPSVEFQVLTGNAQLKSSDATALARAQLLADTNSNFLVKEGLTKTRYYEELANSRLLFNCALQDWVSNTVSEADTLGCQTLYPAYRSFPEVFANDERHMYLPWSVSHAASCVLNLINNQVQDVGRASDYQNQTVNRTIDVFTGKASSVTPTYRRTVSTPKY